MGYAILRIEKRKTAASAAAMSRHALREGEVANAIKGAPKPEVLAGYKTTADVMAALRQGIALAKAKGGAQGFTKATTPVLDLLVTTSAADMQTMTKQAQDAYFKRALGYIAKKFGGMENILTAAIHRDETTPHMQVLVMPLDRTTSRFAAGKMLGGPKGLSAIQDEFYEACGKPFKLMRGEKGSKAKHVPVKNLYTAMNDGMEPPKFVDVPPPLGMLDRLKPGYTAKVEARNKALEHNAKQRKILSQQARVGRSLHPDLVERQADRYRMAMRTVEMEAEIIKKNREDREQVEKERDVAVRMVREAQDAKQATEEMVNSMANCQLLDKFSRHWSPQYVSKIAQVTNTQLIPGKPICDQIRRQTSAKSLQEVVMWLHTIDDKLIESAQRWQAQQSQTDTAPPPIPRPK